MLINMPTFKKSKNKKGLFTKEELSLALKAVLENNSSIRKAAKENNMDRTTLSRYVREAKKNGETNMPKLSMTTMKVGE